MRDAVAYTTIMTIIISVGIISHTANRIAEKKFDRDVHIMMIQERFDG